MEYSIFNLSQECSSAEVEQMLPLVSPQRREMALRFKFLFGQFACLKTYLMLLSILRDHHLIAPDDLPEFDFLEHGKPVLRNLPNVHFNISHCKRALLVAVDNQPIGVDIERIVSERDSLVNYTMNPLEIESIRHSDNPGIQFTRLWTQKEAVLKLQGTGIQGGVKDALTNLQGISIFTETSPDNTYIYTIATTTPAIR